MNIDVRDLQGKVKIDSRRVRRWAEYVLNAMGEDRADLSIVFVDDSYMRRLNWKYRRMRSTTDVLAFPIRGNEGISKDGLILGDVVVSAETAKREAGKRKIPTHKEICLYLVHGILHLLGYDDIRPGDRRRMKAKERELLGAA